MAHQSTRVWVGLLLAALTGPALAQPESQLNDAATSAPRQPAAANSIDVINVPDHPLEDIVAAPSMERTQLRTSPATIVSHNGFTSVQVNVDAFGENYVGDAANEPSIAVDPRDRNVMAIGWRQFDTIESNFRQAGVAYSTDGGGTWTFPGVLDPGQFRSDPVLGSDAGGIFYYSSLSTVRSAEMFRSFDGGATWGLPVPAFGGDKQWIAVDQTIGMGGGHVYQIWNVQFSCCPGTDFTRSTDSAASFPYSMAVPPPSMKWGTMAVGADGTLYLAGATLNQSSHLIARSSTAQDPSQTPTFDLVQSINLGGSTNVLIGPNPSGLLGQVNVATDRSLGLSQGNVYVLASVNPPGGDPLDVMFIRSTDRGMTWTSPVRVNDDSLDTNAWQWFGTMSVAPNGRIDVVFNDTRNSGEENLSELHYTRSTDGGTTWSPNVVVSPMFDSFLGWPQQEKMGDYYDMVSDNDGADLAYAATFNGEQDVYFLRIPFECDATDPTDCNGNDIPDECEIASGSNRDCNLNGIPDDCDAAACPSGDVACQDCDGNGHPDGCDIASDPSLDCNGNNVPDVCECLASATPRAEATVTVKNRYLSFAPNSGPCRTALRVIPRDLPPPFDVLEGEVLWVGAPREYSENGGTVDATPEFDTFVGATLVCDPAFENWAGIDTIHVFDRNIVPGATYDIQAIHEGCDVANDVDFSSSLSVSTARWGDVVENCAARPCSPPDGSVDIVDAVAVLDKFSGQPGAVIKARADLDPAVPDQIIHINDVMRILDTFRGFELPFSFAGMPCD